MSRVFGPCLLVLANASTALAKVSTESPLVSESVLAVVLVAISVFGLTRVRAPR
jgi:hypothetical protein